ncbi:PEP-CTERM sorting domain-containing protein [Geobacter sp.]|uniref:PEP-CTERM sorting domain-containing protein n=1 Tax=Geobacter sp. TaxID=46610 RepID=UPI0027B91116|nr:PEP-CTERM sorting domain-containing protein [Geobacter sp.]
MDRMKTMLFFAVCLGQLVFVSTSPAVLINGDFSAGFIGWEGEVTDLSLTTVSDIDPLPGLFSANFDATSGSAVLTTSTLENEIWSVFLYQEFMIDPTLTGETLTLSYDLVAALSSPGFGDTAFAQLNYGPGLGMALDLFSATSFDVTSLAGQTVQFLFGVEDLDDNADSLTVDNVAITVASTPIPEPGSLGLLGLGLLGAAILRVRIRKM